MLPLKLRICTQHSYPVHVCFFSNNVVSLSEGKKLKSRTQKLPQKCGWHK